MNHPFDTVPEHWQKWIVSWASKRSEGKRDRLGAGDFNGCVRLRFPDDSYAIFECAFYALDEERQELAVFTEHCGYHVFPLFDDLLYSYSVWAESPGDPLEADQE